MMKKPSDTRAMAASGSRADGDARIYSACELFRGAQQLYIEHEGQLYNLKITRQKKLLLTK